MIKYYYFIRWIFAYNGIIHKIAQIESQCNNYMPLEYTWYEKYFIWLEYLYRKSQGEDITFNEVEYEHFCKWEQEIDEALKKFKNER